MAKVNGFLVSAAIQSPLKSHGSKASFTTEPARKVIFADWKRFRMALNAGVQRTASPIGDGSQIKILSSFIACLFSAVHHIKG